MSNSGVRNDTGASSESHRNQGSRPNPNPGTANSGSTFANVEKTVGDKAHDVTNRISELTGQAKDKAKEVTGQVTDKVSELAGQAKDKAKDMTDQVSDKVSEFAGQAKDKAQEWATEAGDAMSHAKDKAQEWATEAADKTSATVKDLGHELTEFIRKYPAPALLIGFGLGFMIAKASSSSRH